MNEMRKLMEQLDRLNESDYYDDDADDDYPYRKDPACRVCGAMRPEECDCEIDEAYDTEVDGKVAFGSSEEMLQSMFADLRELEQITSRIYREVTRSKHRKDYSEMLLNELGEVLGDITDLIEKYEDASVRGVR